MRYPSNQRKYGGKMSQITFDPDDMREYTGP